MARTLDVSNATVGRRIIEGGLRCRVAANQSTLTSEHRIMRLAFCELMLEKYDENGLKNIIFSDEKSFCSDLKHRKLVYRPHNTRLDPKYKSMTRLSGRQMVSFWGAIGKI